METTEHFGEHFLEKTPRDPKDAADNSTDTTGTHKTSQVKWINKATKLLYFRRKSWRKGPNAASLTEQWWQFVCSCLESIHSQRGVSQSWRQ